MKAVLPSQQQAKDFLLPYKVGALFMQPGTGKTRTALMLVNSIDDIDFVVWVGPFNTINPPEGILSIQDEINKWGGFNARIEFVGIESIQASDRTYLNLYAKIQRTERVVLIVDESLKIKNKDAKRTKRLLELAKLTEYRFILNGTPISRNLMDLWSQMEFLSPKILNMGSAEFESTFCEKKIISKYVGGRMVGKKEFITGYANVDYLYSLIRHYMFECDLNLTIKSYFSTLFYSLSEEEKEEYNSIKKHFLSDETLEWRNNNIFLAMTQKMQHSYCCSEAKFNLLDTLFCEIKEEKTIIFCQYIISRELCEKRYPRAIVLSYQKHAYGLNLQDRCNTIYFDKVWDYALRTQSSMRTFRTGQENDCRYWDLTGNVGLDSMIDKNIEKKISMSEYLKKKTKEEIHEEL